MSYNIDMRFEVPQFIEIEDKIFGPFTWKQFIYMAGGAGALLTLYFVAPFIIFILFGIPIGALAGFLAFHKINNRPFSIFLESIVTYFTKTKLYLWKKTDTQVITNESKKELPSDSSTPSLSLKKNLDSLENNLEFNEDEKENTTI